MSRHVVRANGEWRQRRKPSGTTRRMLRIQAHQVDKGVFGDPVHRHAGAMRGDVRDQRQRIDDVAERRGPNDEDAAHR